MTIHELEAERTRLRIKLGVSDSRDLKTLFDSWDFDGSEAEEDAYSLDRLEFLLAS